MIKITIELWPYGIKNCRQKIPENVTYNNRISNKTDNYKESFITYGSNKCKATVKRFKITNDILQLFKTALNKSNLTDKINEEIKGFLSKQIEKENAKSKH